MSFVTNIKSPLTAKSKQCVTARNKLTTIGKVPKIKLQLTNGTRTYHKTICGLCDSGASITCVDQSTFDRLRTQIGVQRVERSRPDPAAANSTILKCLGEFLCDITLENDSVFFTIKNVRFSIFPVLNFPIILGMDLFGTLGLEILGDGTHAVKIGEYNFPTVSNDATGVNFIHHITPFGDQNLTFSQVNVNNIFNSQPLQSPKSPQTLKLTGSGRGTLSFFDDYLFNIPISELKSDLNIKLVNNYDSIDMCSINTTGTVSFTHVDLIKSGEWNLQNICTAIDTERRKLLPETFCENLLKKSEFSPEGKLKLNEILQKFRHIFSTGEMDIGTYKYEQVKVRLKNPYELPPYTKPRPIPLVAKEFVKEKLDELIKIGVFEESPLGSSNNAPVHIIKKKSDKSGKIRFRLCVDYSTTNKYLEQNAFPIPNIRNIIDELAGSNFFSSIDIRSGFWNVKLSPESKDLLSFSVGDRQFRPKRLPMGLSISPGVFQRIMRSICKKYLGKFCQVYLDDCLIYSRTEKDHLEHISKLLKCFEQSGILLNFDKCSFGKTSMVYLGYEISKLGWRILPNRIKSIQDMEPPRTQKQLKRFLGSVAFLSTSCPLLQYKCRALHEVAGKGKRKFEWTEKLQESFDSVKEHITQSCLMAYPSSDPRRRIFLTTDASDKGYGAILTQQDPHGREKPIGFLSGTFKDSQKNWPIRDKELYGLYRGLEQFFDYLWLTKFTFRTDNQCVRYLNSSLKNNPTKNQRLLRWFEFIMSFNFDMELHKGDSQKMAVADMLSRLHEPTAKQPITSLSLLNTNDFWVKSVTSFSDFITHQNVDKDLLKAKTSKYWKSTIPIKSKIVQKEELFVVQNPNGVPLIMVPKSLEKDILHFYHVPLHVAPRTMCKEIKKLYIFPQMYKKCHEYTAECETCVAVKTDRSFKPSRSITSTLPHPWMSVQSDIKGPLGLTLSGNRYIIAFICELTRYAVIRPLKSKDANSIIYALSEVISEFGPMLSLQTDNGTEFKNKALDEFLEKMKITHKFSAPYRPTTNSHVERLNKEIGKFFKIFKSTELEWDQDLKFIQFSANIQYNRALGCSPFHAWHGWLPNHPSYLTFPESDNNTEIKNLDFYMSQRIFNHHKLLSEIYEVEKRRKKDNQKSPIDLPSGQKVLMYFPQPVGSSKLFQNWKNKYVVKKKLDNDTYLVTSENDPRKDFVVYRGRLKPIGLIREPEVSNSGQKIEIPPKGEGIVTEIPENKRKLRKNTKVDYKQFL